MHRFKFEIYECGRMRRETKCFTIFSLKIQRECFLQVCRNLINGLPLRHHGYINALTDEYVLPAGDFKLNNVSRTDKLYHCETGKTMRARHIHGEGSLVCKNPSPERGVKKLII